MKRAFRQSLSVGALAATAVLSSLSGVDALAARSDRAIGSVAITLEPAAAKSGRIVPLTIARCGGTPSDTRLCMAINRALRPDPVLRKCTQVGYATTLRLRGYWRGRNIDQRIDFVNRCVPRGPTEDLVSVLARRFGIGR